MLPIRAAGTVGAAMRRIDYDTEQYQHYARGRALGERQLQTWLEAFAAVLPRARPLTGVDVGSGAGRVIPAPAAPVGPGPRVEPAGRLRGGAAAPAPPPGGGD